MNQEFECNGIGRLTAVPQFTKGKKQDGSDDRAWFVVATNRPKPKDGPQPEAHYTPVVCWGVTARNASQYLEKGQVVSVRGRLNTRTTKRDDGTFDHYAEVVAEHIAYGPKAKNQAVAPAAQPAAQTPQAAGLDPGLVAQLAALIMQQPGVCLPNVPAKEGSADNPFNA